MLPRRFGEEEIPTTLARFGRLALWSSVRTAEPRAWMPCVASYIGQDLYQRWQRT